MKKITEILLLNPANHHCHLREERSMLGLTSYYSWPYSVLVAKPNLKEPVIDAEGFGRYYHNELNQFDFPQIIGGLMMSQLTTPGMIIEAYKFGAKFLANIPRGVSTNGNGFLLSELLSPQALGIYEILSGCQMPLLLHVQDEFNQNLNRAGLAKFFTMIKRIKFLFPELKISIEHPNLAPLIDFIIDTPGLTGGIAPHYALYWRYYVVDRKGKVLRPEIFCQPPYGNFDDRAAVVKAMMNPYKKGKRKFRYAPDDAPHPAADKEKKKPASGVFSGPYGPCIAAEILEKAGKLKALPKLMEYDEDFFNAPLARRKEMLLVREGSIIPVMVKSCCLEPVYFLKGGEKISWQFA